MTPRKKNSTPLHYPQRFLIDLPPLTNPQKCRSKNLVLRLVVSCQQKG